MNAFAKQLCDRTKGVEVVIVDAVRTAWCRRGGALSAMPAAALAATLVGELLLRSGVSRAAVDRLVVGSARSGASGMLAAEVSLRAGLTAPAHCVAMGDISSERALADAAATIVSGRAKLTIAVGVETPSELHLGLSQPLREAVASSRSAQGASERLRAWAGLRPRDLRPDQPAVLEDPVTRESVAAAAEAVAARYGIDRASQDRFAARSHAGAHTHQAARRPVPVPAPALHGVRIIEHDDGPDPGATTHRLARATLLAASDPTLRVPQSIATATAQNVAGPADGAAALLLTSRAHADEQGWPVLAGLAAIRFVVDDPFDRPRLAGAKALLQLCDEYTISPSALQVVELAEPAAALTLATIAAVPGLPNDAVNRHGGAIALGNPAGAGGLRMVMTAVERLGLASGNHALVASGAEAGMGAAVLIVRTP